MKHLSSLLWLLAITVASSGCITSSLMKPAVGDAASYTPQGNEATIIFMRPSVFGGAIQSTVFDVTSPANLLVGIVSARTKIAYKTSPGEHLFMVVSEAADFLKADLAAGKTYYALVTPRMGLWKARFSLKAIHKDQLGTEDFKDWDSTCKFVENTPKSHAWAVENMTDIGEKREEYLLKWTSKPAEDRPVLYRQDGI